MSKLYNVAIWVIDHIIMPDPSCARCARAMIPGANAWHCMDCESELKYTNRNTTIFNTRTRICRLARKEAT